MQDMGPPRGPQPRGCHAQAPLCSHTSSCPAAAQPEEAKEATFQTAAILPALLSTGANNRRTKEGMQQSQTRRLQCFTSFAARKALHNFSIKKSQDGIYFKANITVHGVPPLAPSSAAGRAALLLRADGPNQLQAEKP